MNKRKILVNAFLWIDVLLNKSVYVKQMQKSGFITVDMATPRKQIVSFYRDFYHPLPR